MSSIYATATVRFAIVDMECHTVHQYSVIEGFAAVTCTTISMRTGESHSYEVSVLQARKAYEAALKLDELTLCSYAEAEGYIL